MIVGVCFVNGAPLSLTAGQQNIGFYAYRNANMTISPSFETLITYNTKTNELPVGVFSTVTYRFTAPKDGRYSFTSAANLITAAAGSGYLRLYKNGTRIGEQSDYGNAAMTLSLEYSAVIWLAKTDWVEMRIFQNTGFNATLSGVGVQLCFSGAAIYAEG